MRITTEFRYFFHLSIAVWNVNRSGGMELLFDNCKSLELELLPPQFIEGKATVKELIAYLRDHKLQERPELFTQGETV